MKNRGRLILLLTVIAALGLVVARTQAQRTATQQPSQSQQKPLESMTFNKFSHDSPKHKEMKCDECHIRRDNNPTAKFPSHSACINCHVTQFTAQPVTRSMCDICHQDIAPPQGTRKGFTGQLISFKVLFDGKQHANHIAYPMPDGRPSTDCAVCHQPKANVQNFPDHPQCYQCHSPRLNSKGAEKIGCAICHPAATGPVEPLRMKEGGPLYNYRFTHPGHSRMACAECHNVEGRDSLAPSSPVRRKDHRSTCFTCHNEQRSFGDKSFDNCKRCHGDNFKVQP